MPYWVLGRLFNLGKSDQQGLEMVFRWLFASFMPPTSISTRRFARWRCVIPIWRSWSVAVGRLWARLHPRERSPARARFRHNDARGAGSAGPERIL